MARRSGNDIITDIENITNQINNLTIRQRELASELRREQRREQQGGVNQPTTATRTATNRTTTAQGAQVVPAARAQPLVRAQVVRPFKVGNRVRIINRFRCSRGLGFNTIGTVTWHNQAFIGFMTDNGVKSKRARGHLRHMN